MKEKFYPLKLYLKYRPVFFMLIASLIINVASWVWLAWQIAPQQDLIFLHYNVLFGVDLIGDWWKVYYVPLLGLLIILLNTFIGWVFFGREKFVAHIIHFVSLLCQIFLLIFSALLVFLNV